MRLDEAIEGYIGKLTESGYSSAELKRKRSILGRHLSHALTLCRPTTGMDLCGDRPLRLYNRGTVSGRIVAERRRAAEHFLSVFCLGRREGVTYLTLDAYLQDYRKQYLAGNHDGMGRGRAIDDLCRALGLETELGRIDRSIYDRVLEYLETDGVDRAVTYTVTFFGYCRRQGWITFDPPTLVRGPHERVFDPDFLGTDDGLWTGRLRLYLKYLKNEKNLSDGGIDYYARKLKVFVRWLEDHRIHDPLDTATIKEFLSERERRGVKALTRGKYVYSARYFFDFLLSRGLKGVNPAANLRIKADPPPQQPILSELEVARVIEHLEHRIFETRNPEQVNEHIQHFRALRDLSLFLLFALTGVRLSEALSIDLGNLDFVKRSVRIDGKGNRRYRKKHREILLPNALWRRLTQYLRLRGQSTGRLWVSWSGQPMTGAGVNKVIVERIRQAGIDKQISPHRLRATCASLYLKKGMDPFSLKTLLGHQSVATTMDHYLRFTEEELREVWSRTNPLAGSDDE